VARLLLLQLNLTCASRGFCRVFLSLGASFFGKVKCQVFTAFAISHVKAPSASRSPPHREYKADIFFFSLNRSSNEEGKMRGFLVVYVCAPPLRILPPISYLSFYLVRKTPQIGKVVESTTHTHTYAHTVTI